MEGCEFNVKQNLTFSPYSVKLFVEKDIEANGVKLQGDNSKLTFIKKYKSSNGNKTSFIFKIRKSTHGPYSQNKLS